MDNLPQNYTVMSRSAILLSLCVVLTALNCQRQTPNAPVTPTEVVANFPNIRIDSSAGLFATGPCEPSIAISPVDSNIVVAGAILDRVYYSSNGGITWKKKTLTSPFGVYGDPVLLADAKGDFYYAHLSDPSGRSGGDPTWLDRIVVQKSTDNGVNWSPGTYAGLHHPKDQDKHWLAVDPRDNSIVMTWTEFDKYDSREPKDKSRILFARSSDGGKTWGNEASLSQLEGDCLDDDNTTEGAVPAIGPNGEIYVAWAYANKIYFDRSLDAGKTWLATDKVVAEQPGGWTFDIPGIFRANGLPITATDLSSGPNRGTIYVNWCDQRHGSNDTDVWLAKSTDGGNTWSAPLRVNNDGAGNHQFFTWLAVDPVTGYLYVVFYDRRNHEDDKTDVYLAYSKDGGKTFVNAKISQSPFLPTKDVFFGDYNHLSVYNGRVRPIWTRLQDGKLSVWTALVRLK
ncbi:glycosyl hydrolase BNR repeat-containing protein [Haliscomenobacter hydrossis DSM 1100]|uniref:Glycosyl hydrolase BNR repeat-containing protein n=2 Tax=Haliscomenobacter TaxID=2349 RepID=F4KT52_HALH1|nr:glycosyl hydrolase BNR repeat-containing protein [Haliscomenobacter hydrossis DSM 1100]